jgi:hypothetical protein
MLGSTMRLAQFFARVVARVERQEILGLIAPV